MIAKNIERLALKIVSTANDDHFVSIKLDPIPMNKGFIENSKTFNRQNLTCGL